MPVIGELATLVTAQTAPFQRNINRARRDARDFRTEVNRSEPALKTFRRNLLGVQSAIAGAGAFTIARGLQQSIIAAGDFEESVSKFNTVFGENASVMRAWADSYAESIGRSRKQTMDFLSSTQDLLVPLGVSEMAAAELSQGITQLAVDLASFNNMADADVLRDIQAGLTGSSETMKKYGSIINETAVQQEAFNRGLDPKRITEHQKALLRLSLIYQTTQAAQGDALRTQDSFNNQLKQFNTTIEETSVAVGQKLLPAAEDFLQGIEKSIMAFDAAVARGSGNIQRRLGDGAGPSDFTGGILRNRLLLGPLAVVSEFGTFFERLERGYFRAEERRAGRSRQDTANLDAQQQRIQSQLRERTIASELERGRAPLGGPGGLLTLGIGQGLAISRVIAQQAPQIVSQRQAMQRGGGPFGFAVRAAAAAAMSTPQGQRAMALQERRNELLERMTEALEKNEEPAAFRIIPL